MKTIQTGLRLPEEVRDRVVKKSREIGLSMNDTIIMMLHIGMTVSDKGYVIPIPKK